MAGADAGTGNTGRGRLALLAVVFSLGGRAIAAGADSQAAATAAEALEYFPPPESAGGWRILQSPDQVQGRAGADPGRLEALREWLWQSDNRDFAAVVIRRGYIVLEVERRDSAKTDARRLAVRGVPAPGLRRGAESPGKRTLTRMFRANLDRRTPRARPRSPQAPASPLRITSASGRSVGSRQPAHRSW